MKSVIETVGAYAGLISLLGLVVLCMLCFAQARDLRRLRDWAGGAPERDAEVREVSELVAEERSAELKVLAEREERRLDRSGLGQTSYWERLGRTGRILTIIATVVILGAAAAFAGTTLLGNDSGKGSGGGGGNKSQKAGGDGSLKPGQINVAVLNGTGGAEVGLAAQYADILENDGFELGTVTDAPETFDTSIVMYKKGHVAEAKKVGRSVEIDETGLITSEVADLAPGALVTAVIGTDHGTPPTGG